MNWKQINEKYPKAFLEWVRYEDIITSESKTITFKLADTDDFHELFETDIGYHFWLDQEKIYQLPHYFDELKIITIPKLYDISNTKKWCLEYYQNWVYQGYIMDGTQLMVFPDRLSALKAGVEKAFEIREEQLNKL